jgi:hypothetical protein
MFLEVLLLNVKKLFRIFSPLTDISFSISPKFTSINTDEITFNPKDGFNYSNKQVRILKSNIFYTIQEFNRSDNSFSSFNSSKEDSDEFSDDKKAKKSSQKPSSLRKKSKFVKQKSLEKGLSEENKSFEEAIPSSFRDRTMPSTLRVKNYLVDDPGIVKRPLPSYEYIEKIKEKEDLWEIFPKPEYNKLSMAI